jgi:hypothetical protein
MSFFRQIRLPEHKLPYQELTDWRGSNTKKGSLTTKAKSAIQERMATLANARNVEELKLTTLKQRRLANKEEALATDWAFSQGTNLGGLSYFQCTDVVTPLQVGDTYFYMPVEDLPVELQSAAPGHTRRLCVEAAGGDTRFQVAWTERSSVLHTVLDMGAASWPMQCVLFDAKRGRLRGSFDYDQPHRHHRHHINATERADLSNMSSEL